MSYTNIFGGYNINTAFPSYMNYVISGSLKLNWASSFVTTAAGTNNVTAQINDLAGAPPIAITINNPITTTLGSAVVIVTIPSNPNLETGDMVTIAGATDTNGILAAQLNITAAITVINNTSFSYVSGGVAGGGPFTGGGNAVTYDPLPVVSLADATLISVGQTIQFNNLGTNLITINDFLGNQIVQIPPVALTNQFILYLRDNTTQGGTWGVTHLGAGTSQANANALSGYGTISLNSQINTNFPGKLIGANYVVQLADRASILVWTGGVGTITLPNQLAGFYIAINNEGSGVVSVNTPDGTTIDGAASFLINPSQSAYFIGVGGNWNTLGYGVETFFQVSALNLNLAPVNPSITLTNAQSSKLVQNFTGLLANNVTVYYPAAAGQWYINNATTGPFTVTVQLAGPTGNPFVVPQGERLIFYSDGNSIYNTPTIATSAIFPDGTVGSPGINFQAQNTTGFYRASSGLVGYSSAGTASLFFGGPIPGYAFAIFGGLAQRFYNATNTNFVGFRPPALPTGVTWTLPAADATSPGQILFSNAAGTLGFTAASYPINTGINQLLYSSAVNTISGLATAINGLLVTNGFGAPSIGNTIPLAVQNNITNLGTITAIGSPLGVAFGGTGINTTTPFAVICGGVINTGPLQNAGVGTIGQVLTSRGPGLLPSWQNLSANVATTLGQFSNMSLVNPTINRNINIASIVRTATGQYTITFTAAYANTTYPVFVSASNLLGFITYTTSANSINILVQAPSFAFVDPASLSITIIGL